ncbi:MAG: hypothetical protein BWY86_01380 [Candidatus Aminicenantes bacterium ADurb.Bin508]|nr:MAG: hypothetical protein BWY86_01380 [Candidatus Aminicenantes bacterium ADurb.Bin508]
MEVELQPSHPLRLARRNLFGAAETDGLLNLLLILHLVDDDCSGDKDLGTLQGELEIRVGFGFHLLHGDKDDILPLEGYQEVLQLALREGHHPSPGDGSSPEGPRKGGDVELVVVQKTDEAEVFDGLRVVGEGECLPLGLDDSAVLKVFPGALHGDGEEELPFVEVPREKGVDVGRVEFDLQVSSLLHEVEGSLEGRLQVAFLRGGFGR